MHTYIKNIHINKHEKNGQFPAARIITNENKFTIRGYFKRNCKYEILLEFLFIFWPVSMPEVNYQYELNIK